MFILVQLPLADLRPLLGDQHGRLTVPDWTSDDPGRGFIRGFGKLASRNSRAYGLVGERFFADFNNAVRLRETFAFQGDGWRQPLQAELRFRRMYYDGLLAGRFEFGFLIPDGNEEILSYFQGNLTVDPRAIAAQALRLPVGVCAPSCDEHAATIRSCSKLLGLAYLAATTSAARMNEFRPEDEYGRTVALGPPLVQIRLANDIRAEVGRDRRDAEGTEGRLFFTSSVDGAERNDVIVHLSQASSQNENAEERARRVLFSHLHSLLFAQAQFVRVEAHLDFGGKKPLKEALAALTTRLARYKASGPADETDEAFARAMKIWGSENSGRVDALSEKLCRISEEASKQGPVELGLSWMNSVFELALKTAVSTTLEQGMKAGGG